MGARDRKARGLGPLAVALDLSMIALSAYLASGNRFLTEAASTGLVRTLASLPTPRAGGANASSPGSGSHPGAAPWAAASLSPQWTVSADPRWQAAWDFAVGDDLGRYAADDSQLRDFHDNHAWLNRLVLTPLGLGRALPHGLATYARNLAAGYALYFGLGALWSVAIYWMGGAYFFPDKSDVPSWPDVVQQMQVAAVSIPAYAAMPTFGEWAVEKGLSRAAFTVEGMGGWGLYFAWFAVYILLVEWGIFWVHRILHWKPIYWLHRPHHIYNNKNSLSPFAGLAFHPVDGMLQASPYNLWLFVVPVHFWTHLAALFFTGVWTTSIHDTITMRAEPVMGAGYHTLHHTLYKDNYGQYFVFWDWVHGTLTPPDYNALEAKMKEAKKSK